MENEEQNDFRLEGDVYKRQLKQITHRSNMTKHLEMSQFRKV